VDYIHGKGFAAHLIWAFSSSILYIIGVLYVNDMDLFAIAEYPLESTEGVACCMKQMGFHWRGCLSITGSDLNLDKCCWTPISFYWDNNGQWHYCTDIAVSIHIPDYSSEMQFLQRLLPAESTMVVGMVQAVDGNMVDQVLALQAIVDEVGEWIQKGYLPKCLIWQALHSMVWPSIQYPPPTTTISKEESEGITKKLYIHFLPSRGTNRNFPGIFRHAPYAFFGIALPQGIHNQFIGQVKKFLTHSTIPSNTGRLANISLE
jgi:hypothetical protein